MDETWDTIFRDTTRFWVQFVFVPVVVVIGVLGNSLTIYILTRKQMRLSSKVYLTALTLSDLLFLIFSFSMTWKNYDCVKSLEMYWSYLPFGLWITDASSSTSVWLTVVFTIERYIAICHPRLSQKVIPNNESRSAIVVTVVFFVCFLLTSSTPFEWKVIASDSAPDFGENFTTFDLENTDFGKNAWYRLIYRWFSTVFFIVLPLLILTIGNIFLIHAVRSSHKIRQTLVSCYAHRHQSRRMVQQDRITISLIAIIFVFFICQLPTAAILIYTSMHTPLKDSVEENVLLGLGNLFNLLVAMNAECNFILYTAVSEKYRRSFLRLFCLESLLKRWYNRKLGNEIGLRTPKIHSKTEELKEPNAEENLATGTEEIKDCQKGCEDHDKKCLATMRTCSTCEIIRQESLTMSFEESQEPMAL